MCSFTCKLLVSVCLCAHNIDLFDFVMLMALHLISTGRIYSGAFCISGSSSCVCHMHAESVNVFQIWFKLFHWSQIGINFAFAWCLIKFSRHFALAFDQAICYLTDVCHTCGEVTGLLFSSLPRRHVDRSLCCGHVKPVEPSAAIWETLPRSCAMSR